MSVITGRAVTTILFVIPPTPDTGYKLPEQIIFTLEVLVGIIQYPAPYIFPVSHDGQLPDEVVHPAAVTSLSYGNLTFKLSYVAVVVPTVFIIDTVFDVSVVDVEKPPTVESEYI